MEMLKLGKIEFGDVPRIIVTAGDINAQIIKKAKKDGAEILELRLDEFRKTDTRSVQHILKSAKTAGLPIIATIRSKKEGGKKFISPQGRLRLFEMIIPDVEGVDIELSSKNILGPVIESARRFHKLVIISYHNFIQTPPEDKIEKIIREAAGREADIIKISTMAKTPGDILTLGYVTFRNKSRNIITLAMGRLGAVSRTFFPMLGSLATYGFSDKSHAPGQLSIKILKRDLETYFITRKAKRVRPYVHRVEASPRMRRIK
jgi:3-dehydroquinate dehydratase I